MSCIWAKQEVAVTFGDSGHLYGKLPEPVIYWSGSTVNTAL